MEIATRHGIIPGSVRLAQAHPLAKPPAIEKTAFRRTWSCYGPHYVRIRALVLGSYIMVFELGMLALLFDTFDSACI